MPRTVVVLPDALDRGAAGRGRAGAAGGRARATPTPPCPTRCSPRSGAVRRRRWRTAPTVLLTTDPGAAHRRRRGDRRRTRPGPALLDAVAVMDRLRSPGGCPWDAEQTHESLLPYLVEECYELYQAIEDGDRDAVREELGDVLLQVLFHARIAAEDGARPFDDRRRGRAIWWPSWSAGTRTSSPGTRADRHRRAPAAPLGGAQARREAARVQCGRRAARAARRRARREAGQPHGPGRAARPTCCRPAREWGSSCSRWPPRPSWPGIDPEAELRAAARRFADAVRAAERAAAAAGADPHALDAAGVAAALAAPRPPRTVDGRPAESARSAWIAWLGAAPSSMPRRGRRRSRRGRAGDCACWLVLAVRAGRRARPATTPVASAAPRAATGSPPADVDRDTPVPQPAPLAAEHRPRRLVATASPSAAGCPARALRAYGTRRAGAAGGDARLPPVVEHAGRDRPGRVRPRAAGAGRPRRRRGGPAVDRRGAAGRLAGRRRDPRHRRRPPRRRHRVRPGRRARCSSCPATWARYGADGNGDGVRDPHQLDDAALAAARYLCADGRDTATGEGWWDGVLAYNRSVDYARLVWAAADRYASRRPRVALSASTRSEHSVAAAQASRRGWPQ